MKMKLAGVAGLATTLTLTGTLALPAQAAKPELSPTTYSALGDSFAAGFGAGTPITPLGQSAEAYPGVLAGGLSNLTFLAVPFEGTTATVAALQIPAIPPATRQVTLTVGGNDVGFVEKATACFLSPTACALTDADRAKLAALPADLSGTIAAIHDKAPAAKIYVTGYPLLFQAAQTPGNNGLCVVGVATSPAPSIDPVILSEAQADALDAAAVALNRAVKASIVGPTHRYAKYVDVTAAFTGHGLCGTPSPTSATSNPDTYINPVHVTMTGIPPNLDPVVEVATGPLHPNADGQMTYAASIRGKGFKV